MKTILTAALCLIIFNSCGKKDPTVLSNHVVTNEALKLSISGEYSDPYNSTHAIDDEKWIVGFEEDTSTYEILEFNNEENFIIALNGDDSYNPGEFSRFEWLERDGILYYCQSIYNAQTQEQARQSEKADPTDPSNSGCGSYSFPWTELI